MKHVVLTVVALAGMGCVPFDVVDIDTSDRDVLLPMFRASAQIYPPPRNSLVRRRPREGSFEGFEDSDAEVVELQPSDATGPVKTFSLDFELSFGNGDSSQDLGSGQRISFNNTSFPGPATVSADYDLYVVRFTGRGGMIFDEMVRMEGMVGLGFQNLELELESGSIRDSDVTFSVGPLFGGRLTVEPLPWLALYAQATYTYAWYVNLGDVELALAVSPVPGVTLISGWRWWFYDEERSFSDTDLDLSGPMIGLLLSF